MKRDPSLFIDDIIKFSIPDGLCCGVTSNPTLVKGGKGGFSELINLPKDTPPSLRRGVFIEKESVWKVVRKDLQALALQMKIIRDEI